MAVMASMERPAYLTAWRGVMRRDMSASEVDGLAPATPSELTFKALVTLSKIRHS